MININGTLYKIYCNKTDGTTVLYKKGKVRPENRLELNSFELLDMIVEEKATRI